MPSLKLRVPDDLYEALRTLAQDQDRSLHWIGLSILKKHLESTRVLPILELAPPTPDPVRTPDPAPVREVKVQPPTPVQRQEDYSHLTIQPRAHPGSLRAWVNLPKASQPSAPTDIHALIYGRYSTLWIDVTKAQPTDIPGWDAFLPMTKSEGLVFRFFARGQRVPSYEGADMVTITSVMDQSFVYEPSVVATTPDHNTALSLNTVDGEPF